VAKKAKSKYFPKKKKQPPEAVVYKKKQPKYSQINNPDSILKRRPVWRIDLIDIEGQWGWWNVSSKEKLLEIKNKLNNIQSMTWEEIDRDKKYNHFVDSNKIEENAKKRLSEKNIDADKIDNLYRFRLSGRERVWGIREQEFFYLLWWDPQHQVWPSHKKHT
jgi:hypothetical protein